MRSVPPQLIGFNVKELSRICHVSLKTATRWKDGSTCPPESALMLLVADLGCFDATWKGWTVRRGNLISPEGWEITLGDVISSPLLRQQLAAFKTELKRLRAAAVAADAMQDQPLPADFPDWIAEMRA
jgi:hypothetical protein